MKTIKYFFFVAMATLLMAADCSNKDSEFYNDVFVTVPDLIDVNSFVREGQTISINDSIPRFLPTQNMSNLLDIYKTTGGATKLIFSYELEKENTDGTWDFIEFTSENVTTVVGESEIGSFVVGSFVFNPSTNYYRYNASIQTLNPGNYRFSFGYNSFATNLIEFRSESIGNNLSVNIESPTAVLNGTGYYKFTVTP